MNEKLPRPYVAQVPARQPRGSVPGPGIAYEEPSRPPTVLWQIRDMLVRRRWTFLVSILVVLGVAAFLTSRMQRLYESTVTILVGTQQGAQAPSAVQDLLSQFGQFGPPGDVDTEMTLLQSRRIIDPVVDKYDLHVGVESPGGRRAADVLPAFAADSQAVPGTYVVRAVQGDRYEVRKTDPDSVLGNFAAGQLVGTHGLRFALPPKDANEVVLVVWPFESAVYGVMGRLEISLVDEDASVMQLTCSGSTPEEARLTCSALSESYIAMRNDLQRSEAVHTAELMRQQSDTVQAQLARAEEELRSYQERNQVVAPEVQASSEIEQYATLQARRDQLEAERVALSGFISQVTRGNAATASYRQLAAFPTFIDNPMVGDLVKNLMEYENQLAELRQRRTDQNPDVIELRGRIADLEGQLGRMSRTYESALAKQVSALDGTLGRSQGRLASVPEKQMELVRLQRHAELLNQFYTTLQQRLRGAEIAQAVETADVQVIDAASLPLEPSSPNVRMNMALALVAGLLFGLAAALVQEFADTRLRRRDDVEREMGLPVLTTVPSVRRQGFVAGREVRLLKKGAARLREPLPNYYPVGGESIVEAFRSLGADLTFMGGRPEAESARTVVFTSAARGEGKTFNAVNFAATRALQGQRTLLIDGDLRAGAAGAMLGLNGGAGLSDVLAGDVKLLDAVRMVKVGDHRLAVLGIGRLKEDPGKLLNPAALDEVLTAAAENFEQVVIDTPPLNVVSDAALFAARVDAVVVVVRAGRTDRDALDMTLTRLGRVGANIVGAVLNDVGAPESPGRYAYEAVETTAPSNEVS